MIKLIIFDYDGVIVNSFSGTYKAYKVICKRLNKKVPRTVEGFRKIYGYNYRECYRNLGITQEESLTAEEIYKEEVIKNNPKLYKGIDKVLEKLSKKYIIALVSANYMGEVMQKLKKFKIDKYFRNIVAKEETESPNLPKAQAFAKLINKFNVSKEETLMVGDREIDYDKAVEAGVKYKIIVEYGWGYNREKLTELHQNIPVYKPEDLLKVIKNLDR